MASDISVLTPNEAISLDKSCGEVVACNFHDLFGITGCLLSCEQRRAVQTRRESPTDLNNMDNTHLKVKPNNQYFSPAALQDSVNNGCGSCGFLQKLLQITFGPLSPIAFNDSTVYNVSYNFDLRQMNRANGASEIRSVRLFQPLDRYIRLYSIPSSEFLDGNTGSKKSTNKLKEWLRTCDESHRCYKTGDRPQLPTRLIHVTETFKNGMLGVRLIESKAEKPDKYVALSHCWGSKKIDCCTTKSFVLEAKGVIEYTKLTKTFMDAITITREIGINYLWIDSICIIQDSKDDWAYESSKMADVYQNAYLTIAASGSADSSGGCFSSTASDLALYSQTNHGPLLFGARMCDNRGLLQERSEIQHRFPLFTRGWVYQERLLSKRIVFYNYGELSFQCLEGSGCECENISMPPHAKLTNAHGMIVQMAIRRQIAEISTSQTDTPNYWKMWESIWESMVTTYMALNLTKQQDVLPAISGCAKVIADVTGDQYHAGLWGRNFAKTLLWYNSSTKKDKKSRPHSTTPTWSWASLSPAQSVLFLDFKPVFTDSSMEVKCKPKGANPFGEISIGTGLLKLEVALFPGFLPAFCWKNLKSISRTRGKNGNPGIYYNYRRRTAEDLCEMPESGIDARNGIFSVHLDIPYQLIIRSLELLRSTQCPICAMGRIFLLHAGHTDPRTIKRRGKSEWGQSDAFIMLKMSDPNEKRFERIGLAVFDGHTPEERETWFRDVWAKGVLPKEEITIV